MFLEEFKQTLHNFAHFMMFMGVGLMVMLLAIGETYGLIALGLQHAPKIVRWLFESFLMFQVIIGMVIVVFGSVQFFLARARSLYVEFFGPLAQKQSDVPQTADH